MPCVWRTGTSCSHVVCDLVHKFWRSFLPPRLIGMYPVSPALEHDYELAFHQFSVAVIHGLLLDSATQYLTARLSSSSALQFAFLAATTFPLAAVFLLVCTLVPVLTMSVYVAIL